VNCTVTDNTASGTAAGGGISNNGATDGKETELVNTIVAGNHSTDSPDYSGTLFSGGHNLIGNTTGVAVDVPHSDTRPAARPCANVHFGALAANGGLTKTHALRSAAPRSTPESGGAGKRALRVRAPTSAAKAGPSTATAADGPLRHRRLRVAGG
jgi:hypothetical protein